MVDTTQQISTPPAAVPVERLERERIRRAVEAYIEEYSIKAPLTAADLLRHVAELLSANDISIEFEKFTAILLNNSTWAETVANTPFNRRILFLPQCVRDTDKCTAEMDELGFICADCGACEIGRLQREAEALGYAVLVAEGTSVVTRMLLSGEVDTVIGVSCISVLEKAFPFVTAGAVPSLAFPLLRDGCQGTEMDLDWIEEAIHLKSGTMVDSTGAIFLDNLRSRVDQWFDVEALAETLGSNGSKTEEIGIHWLSRGGKRWRPLLAASAFEALTGIDPTQDERIRRLAIAVECFHKASLIHDDIEDDDEVRYGLPTLHLQHGMPVALNAGDYLLGEGYRCIGECGATSDAIARMLTVAARGHCDLSLGQGDELWWTHRPGPLTVDKVIEIFRLKTAPAFEVALSLGAICGGADVELCETLSRFSENLGIAYQIQDDLEDYGDGEERDDIDAMRPSLLMALCYVNATDELRKKMETAWQIHRSFSGLSEDLHMAIEEMNIPTMTSDLLTVYRNKAFAELESLQESGLKQLLTLLTGKIIDAG
ncbi:hypothetical protein BVY04_03845 [bacterium M21]|nr:hypothetical protein BVY04_03845 [bacterium M21]